MAEPRKPQDHLPPKMAGSDPESGDHFTFTHDGETYVMPVKTTDAITVKFVRQNRRRDETDYTFTALEALAGDSTEGTKALDAIDGMSRAELRVLIDDLTEHLGAVQGE